jgi:hypothetical protein
LVIVSAVLLLTHFFVAAAVVEEQLQPSDPNHPEYGLKPAATLDAVNGIRQRILALTLLLPLLEWILIIMV